MFYIGVRDRKREKEVKINLSFVFCQPLSMCIQNLKTLVLIEAKNFVTENLLGEKKKWTNKGNDKQQNADSLFHNTTSHIQHLYQISKSKAQ